MAEWEKILEGLAQLANEAISLSSDVMDAVDRYDDEDDYQFMLVCYHRVLDAQFQSVVSLCNVGQHRDALLIARSMLEKWALMTWVQGDKTERAFLWRYYAWIQDWRKMIELGGKADAAIVKAIRSQLRQIGGHFHTRKARKATAANKELPADPYFRSWYEGRSVSDIFEQVGLLKHYKHIYGPASEWSHASPKGVGMALKRTQKAIDFSVKSDSAHATAMAVGTAALLEIVGYVNEQFDAGFDGQVDALKKKAGKFE